MRDIRPEFQVFEDSGRYDANMITPEQTMGLIHTMQAKKASQIQNAWRAHKFRQNAYYAMRNRKIDRVSKRQEQRRAARTIEGYLDRYLQKKEEESAILNESKAEMFYDTMTLQKMRRVFRALR